MACPKIFEHKHKIALLSIILFSILFRFIFYQEIKHSPLFYTYRWDQTDMNFFHEWACHIAQGDWLTNASFHPYHHWHQDIAHLVLKEKNDEQGKALGNDGTLHPMKFFTREKDGEKGRTLWNRWYGEKRFHQEPLYAYFMGFVYGMKGTPWPEGIVFLQMLLGVATNVLVFYLAAHFFGYAVGALSAVLALFYGPFLFYEWTLLRTSLTTFLSLMTVCLWTYALSKKTRWAFLVAGFSSASLILLQASMALFVGLAFLFCLFPLAQSRKEILRSTSFFLLGFLIALTPVVARNLYVGASPLSLTSVGAVTFAACNNPNFVPDAGWEILEKNLPAVASLMEKSQGNFLPSIYHTIASHDSIWSYAKLLLVKFLVIFNAEEIPNNVNYHYYALYSSFLSYGQMQFSMVVGLCLVGLVLNGKRWKDLRLLYFFLFASFVTLTVFYTLSRFKTSFMPFLLPFGAYTLVFVFREIHAKKYALACALLCLVPFINFLSALGTPRLTQLLHVTDYCIGNQIALEQVHKNIEKGNLRLALHKAQKVLTSSEPVEIRKVIQGETGIVCDQGFYLVALGFRDLYLVAAQIQKKLGATEKAKEDYGRYLPLYRFLRKVEQAKRKAQK